MIYYLKSSHDQYIASKQSTLTRACVLQQSAITDCTLCTQYFNGKVWTAPHCEVWRVNCTILCSVKCELHYSVQYEVWTALFCAVWSVNCTALRSVKSCTILRSMKWELHCITKCEEWSALFCAVWSVNCTILSSVKCELHNSVQCEVWTALHCKVWTALHCEMWSVNCTAWNVSSWVTLTYRILTGHYSDRHLHLEANYCNLLMTMGFHSAGTN